MFVRRGQELTSLLPKSLRSIWNIERVIDDFILFCFLAGNDFLPHLPFTEIGSGGLHRIMALYRSYLFEEEHKSHPWLTENCGSIHWSNFYRFLCKWAKLERMYLEEKIDESNYLQSKLGPTRERRELVPFTNFLEVSRDTRIE